MIVLCIVLFIYLIQVPVFIARGRGISGAELTTITVLSWCGIFFGITWVVALILALVWQPGLWLDKGETQGDTADELEKLHKLKQKGIISQKEFDAQKRKLLK
jgi:hypothetical protein